MGPNLNPQEGNRPYARLTGGWRIRRMRHTTLWIPIVAFLLCPPLTPARAADTTLPPTMTVTASAEVRAVPDMAVIQLGVSTRGSTAQEAMAKNNVLMNQIVDALKKLGIPDDHLQTSY